MPIFDSSDDAFLREYYRYHCRLLRDALTMMEDAVGNDKIKVKVEQAAYDDLKKFLPALETLREELLRRNEENATF